MASSDNGRLDELGKHVEAKLGKDVLGWEIAREELTVQVPAARIMPVLTMLRDAFQWTRLRGRHGLLAALPLGPLKELALIGVWAVAPFMSRVAWRGKRFRVAAGTRLYAERPMGTPVKLESE